MSGIAGIFNLDERPVDADVLTSIGSTIAHRGCGDRRDTWYGGSIGFIAHADDVSDGSRKRQTLADQYGNSLVFDGRLDNRDELLTLLDRGSRASSISDSQLVFAAFQHFGKGCLPRLNGDFAVAFFDGRRRELILARDAVGCRPLYYWTDRRTVVFGSEIKTVLAHPDVVASPNRDLIADYLVRDRLPFEDYGETYFEGICAVLPGCRLTVSTGGIATDRFWDFDPASRVELPSYSDYAERLRELLVQAIKRRLRTPHAVAIAASGGLDSSIVFCVAAQLQRQGETMAPLLPIALSALENHATDELTALRLLESATELRIERRPFGGPGNDSDLQKAALDSEWPRFDDGWCAMRPLFECARAQGARTLLSGHWSDQLLFTTGYLSDLFTSFRWTRIAADLGEYSRWFVDADPHYFRRRFARELAFNLTSHSLRRSLRRFVRSRRSVNWDRLFAANLAARVDRHRPALNRPRCLSAHTRTIYQTVRAKARRLQIEADEKLAARCGIQWTTPFLDRDLIAYVMSVPGEIQQRGGVPRALLRDAMRGIVPDEILQRRWKNEDEIACARRRAYLSTARTLDAAHALGFLQRPVRVDGEALELLGLEFWSRAFFSDRLIALQRQPNGVREAMDTRDPAPKDNREKLPYSPPKLTVHGDLRTITAAKQSDRSETGLPKTFNSGMP
jgi:asparagine synthase (glutamine-hydrolysing)